MIVIDLLITVSLFYISSDYAYKVTKSFPNYCRFPEIFALSNP